MVKSVEGNIVLFQGDIFLDCAFLNSNAVDIIYIIGYYSGFQKGVFYWIGCLNLDRG